MDIGLVVHYYDRTSGTGGYVVELATRLAREHRVTIYAAGLPTEPPAGARVVRVPALRGRAYATILTFPVAFAAVRRRHDIVHSQGWTATRADVVTAHIVLGAWRPAAARAGVRAPTGERLLGGWVEGRERGLISRARGVIAPSRRAADDIARCYGRTSGVTVVHHGFPAQASLPAREAARSNLGVPAGAFVALYAGDARKGADAAIRALTDARGVHLLVASHSRGDEYLGRARQLGLGDRVYWPPAIPDVRLAFAAADVLIHPTIYDTFALVAAEAMAWGVPVVVSREAGIADLIEHERNGWLLAPDGTGAAAALTRLREDPGLRRRLADAARETARDRTWDRVAQETLAVYEAVGDRRRET
jgi:UDP-glucose:(heptosyl)LPS alpha-1,3-glucosyltransferase